jgi:hypothetical protein
VIDTWGNTLYLKGGKMNKIVLIIFACMFLISSGCTNKDKELPVERESLEKYADIFTLEDLHSVVTYTGVIEREVEKTPQAVHIRYYLQTKKHKKKSGDEIFILHLEYLMSSESQLRDDMKTSEAVSGIGDRAWYESFQRGQSELVFYIADRNILVGLEGRNRNSDYPASIKLNREEFISLAALIENRLK